MKLTNKHLNVALLVCTVAVAFICALASNSQFRLSAQVETPGTSSQPQVPMPPATDIANQEASAKALYEEIIRKASEPVNFTEYLAAEYAHIQAQEQLQARRNAEIWRPLGELDPSEEDLDILISARSIID